MSNGVCVQRLRGKRGSVLECAGTRVIDFRCDQRNLNGRVGEHWVCCSWRGRGHRHEVDGALLAEGNRAELEGGRGSVHGGGEGKKPQGGRWVRALLAAGEIAEAGGGSDHGRGEAEGFLFWEVGRKVVRALLEERETAVAGVGR